MLNVMDRFLQLSIVLGCAMAMINSISSFKDVQSDPAQSLLNTLRLFSGQRHHRTNPAGKEAAQKLIQKRLTEAGLHVWSEEVILTGQGIVHGKNIVGMLKGQRTGTVDDQIVIVGAHYDTTSNTIGVDDNGSGVTALLETAKQIGKVSTSRIKNTILFVAFDFEERTPECDDFSLCGSLTFVRNLTKYLTKTNGTVNGALILETIINHNTSAGSQKLPSGSNVVSPVAYKEIQKDLFRGNFLAVVGRSQQDKKLLSLIGKHYEKDSDYRAQLVPIPLTGKPSDNRQFSPFYRSDHYRFWDNDVPYSALMLTDTADHRGYMQKCYHKLCDEINPYVKDDDLEFLRRTINTVIKTSLELSEADGSPRYVMNLQLLSIAIIIAIKYS